MFTQVLDALEAFTGHLIANVHVSVQTLCWLTNLRCIVIRLLGANVLEAF